MQNSKKWLTTPFQQINRKLVYAIGLLGLIGFADAVYLTVEHFMGKIPPCSVTGGCETVLTSQYSNIFGIPVSLLGSIFYFLVILSVLLYLESKRHLPLKAVSVISIFGLLASIWFVFLQAFIIKSYCAYCLVSAVTSISIFVLSMFLVKGDKAKTLLKDQNE